LDHDSLFRHAKEDGYETEDPAEALYWYLNKKGYSNLSLSKHIGVSEGTIRYWLKFYDLVWPEFCCKVRIMGYDSPGSFIRDALQKNLTVHEMSVFIGVSPVKFQTYMDCYYERVDNGEKG